MYIYIYVCTKKPVVSCCFNEFVTWGFDDFFTVDYARRQPKRPNNWTTLMQVGVCV